MTRNITSADLSGLKLSRTMEEQLLEHVRLGCGFSNATDTALRRRNLIQATAGFPYVQPTDLGWRVWAILRTRTLEALHANALFVTGLVEQLESGQGLESAHDREVYRRDAYITAARLRQWADVGGRPSPLAAAKYALQLAEWFDRLADDLSENPVSGHPGDVGHAANRRSFRAQHRADSAADVVRAILEIGPASIALIRGHLEALGLASGCGAEYMGPIMEEVGARVVADDSQHYGEPRMWELAGDPEDDEQFIAVDWEGESLTDPTTYADAVAAVNEACDALKANGWSVDRSIATEGNLYGARATRGSSARSLFVERVEESEEIQNQSMSDPVDQAREMGRQAALSAATWVTDGNTTAEHVRKVLALIDEGDDASEFLPRMPDLSGEWADELTPIRLWERITGEDHSDAAERAGLGYETLVGSKVDAYANAWEEGVSEAFEPACAAELLKVLPDDELTYIDSEGVSRSALVYLAKSAGDAPYSRYGVRTDDHTPIILAVARIYAESAGELTESILNSAASLVVNDSDEVAVMIVDHGTAEEIALLDADVAEEGRRMSDRDYGDDRS